MSEAAGATLKRFLLQTGARAERALDSHYQGSSAQSIQSILRRAMGVLATEDAQAALALELEHVSEIARTDLLACMGSIATESCESASSPEAARRIIIELAAIVGQRVPESITHALSRLDLVLSLGQTDEHQLLSHAALS
jgi:hypothetical protein